MGQLLHESDVIDIGVGFRCVRALCFSYGWRNQAHFALRSPWRDVGSAGAYGDRIRGYAAIAPLWFGLYLSLRIVVATPALFPDSIDGYFRGYGLGAQALFRRCVRC